MPDNTHEESLNHIRELNAKNTDYIVRTDSDIKGNIDIDVRVNGRFDVTVYKGDSHEPQKIEDISKDELLEMLSERL